jgi:phosphoglycolate phosphatase-like HAD superfamily hydrolase
MEQAFEAVFGVASVASQARGIRFAGATDPGIMASLARAAGLDGQRYTRRRAELEATYLRALAEVMARPDPRRRSLPGVRALLEDLHGRSGAHLGLLTGNLERGARMKLEPFDLNRFFPDGGFGSDHGDRREVARQARDKLSRHCGIDFDAARVVVIGDTEWDVDCARANGFRAVAVDSGWGSHEALEAAAPDALLPDLSDREQTLLALGF